MSVSLKDFPEFDAKVQGWFRAVEKASAEVAVGLAKTAFNHILYNAPQFSGDFVANIKVGVGHIDSTFKIDALPHQYGVGDYGSYSMLDPFGRGDTEAIGHAKGNAAGEWGKMALGQSIFISSTAVHDEPYTWLIEDGKIKFREVNTGASAVFRRGFSYVKNRYSTIGISQFNVLRRVGV